MMTVQFETTYSKMEEQMKQLELEILKLSKDKIRYKETLEVVEKQKIVIEEENRAFKG